MEYYQTPLSFTSQFYFCPVPLRLDTYSGCRHNCKYCFANNSSTKYINQKREAKIKITSLKQIEKYFKIAFEGEKNIFKQQEAITIECLKKKVPIHFGGMSDPLQPLEENYEITYYTLKLLKKYDYPYILSTKGKLLLKPKYYNLIKKTPKSAVQISLIDTREEIIKALEPNTSTVKERLKMFEILKEKWTGCRIQPLIPMLTEKQMPKLINELAKRNVNHVMIEALKFFTGNKNANKKVSETFKKLTGKTYNLEAYYKSLGSKYQGNDLELPTWRKYEYVKPAKKQIEKLGMTFGCADNDLRYMSTEKINPCCCGINNLKGFENVIKHNTGYAIKRAIKNNKKIKYSLIENEWFPEGVFREVINLKRLKKKYGKNATYKYAEKKVKKMFKEEWEKKGKNSPLQQDCVENDEKGEYCLKKEFIKNKNLEQNYKNKSFKQKQIFDY